MAQQNLKRLLGRGFSIAACVGLVVGLGILRTPGEIAAVITDPGVYMALWIGGGMFVLLSVAVVAELFAMTPKSGGMYALVAHAYGPYPGFLIGWIDFVAGAASAALKSVVLLEYLALLMPGLGDLVTPGALVITTAFASLQLGGVRFGGSLHQSAVACIGLMMVLVTASLFYGVSAAAQPITLFAALDGAAPELAQYGLVIAAVVFTYDGWYATSYFGGEIQGGGRDVALGSLRGILFVIGLYVLLNLALVQSVSLESLQGHDLALAGALEILYGVGTPVIVVALVILLTHQNLQYMISSRVLYALSVDGFGSQRATSVTDKGTPIGAVFITWMLTVFLILLGGFEFLLGMSAMLFMLMYIALMVGVFRLRRQEPNADRPYRAWGFPATGYICTVGWIGMAVFVAVSQPDTVLYGLVLILVSVPAYWWLKSSRHLDRSMSTQIAEPVD